MPARLPMLAILTLGHCTRPRLDARGPLLLARARGSHCLRARPLHAGLPRHPRTAARRECVPPAGRRHVPDRRRDSDPRRLSGASRRQRHRAARCGAGKRLSRSFSSPRGLPPRPAVAIHAGHLHDALAPLAKAAGWVGAATVALVLLRRLPAAFVRAGRVGGRAADDRRSRASTTGRANRPRCRLRATPCSIRTPRTRRSCCSSGC